MTGLPAPVEQALRELSLAPVRAEPLTGGMINRAARVETTDGDVFVKWNTGAPAGFYAAEAHGLETLRAAHALRVPCVLGLREADGAGDTAALVLEYIPIREPSDRAAFARRFGEQLATLHRLSRASDGRPGLDRDNYIGSLPQRNGPTARWPQFYRERRLLPQIEIARQRGHLPAERERLLDGLIARLDDLLAGLSSEPVLLHGDLWSGNFLTAGEEPVLIDPAAHYGEREMEIAYIELFGGFPPGFLQAYRSAFPQEPGYEHRRTLHQLYPLLVHLNHFGEGYGADVDAVCRQYL